MKCTKLNASKLSFLVLLCCLCGVFTAPCVLQWILTCRYLAGHGALKNTMDSELRCRIASVYEAIMSRHNLAGHDPIVKHNGFGTSKQNPFSIPSDPDSLHVGSPHRSGKKVVVGIFLVDIGFAIARVRIH